MPELEEPTYITPLQGLTLISQMAALRSKEAEAAHRLELQLAEREQIARLSLAEKDRQLDLMQSNYQSQDMLRRAEAANQEAKATTIYNTAQEAQFAADEQSTFENNLSNLDPKEYPRGSKKWWLWFQQQQDQQPHFWSSKAGAIRERQIRSGHQVIAGEEKEDLKQTGKQFYEDVYAITRSGTSPANTYFNRREWAEDLKDPKMRGRVFRIVEKQTQRVFPKKTKFDESTMIKQAISKHDFELLQQEEDLFLGKQRKSYFEQPDDTPRVQSPSTTDGGAGEGRNYKIINGKLVLDPGP